MDLSRVIVGPVYTEKAERLKTQNTYVLRIDQHATKIDVKNALRRFYNTEVSSVRVQRIRPKSRLIGAGRTMTKRHPRKHAIVTLAKDSKPLDLAQFSHVSR